jgi:hypothetical protein
MEGVGFEVLGGDWDEKRRYERAYIDSERITVVDCFDP